MVKLADLMHYINVTWRFCALTSLHRQICTLHLQFLTLKNKMSPHDGSTGFSVNTLHEEAECQWTVSPQAAR